MRGKRAKAYRKLMHQYAVHFNFREPYQVLCKLNLSPARQSSLTVVVTVDSQIIQDAARYKMDLIGGLERTLQGKVKPSTFVLARRS